MVNKVRARIYPNLIVGIIITILTFLIELTGLIDNKYIWVNLRYFKFYSSFLILFFFKKYINLSCFKEKLMATSFANNSCRPKIIIKIKIK